MACKSKKVGRRGKQTEMWESGCGSQLYEIPFNLLVCKVNLVIIQGTFLKLACDSKMAANRAKWSEICDSGDVTISIWGTFDLLVFKVIWGSFGVIVSKWPGTRKRLAVERNE